MTLKDKIIIVTGAASGMGRAATEMLCNEGAVVYAADRQQEALEQGCKTTGALPSVIDISSSTECDALVTRVVQERGRLDGIVNFAGVLKRTGILDCTNEEFDFVMNVNVKGCFYLCRAAARVMKKQGFGSIVNVSSIWSDVGAAGVLAYCASKGAVSQITRSAALDLAGSGVRVNEIRPGETNTPMLASERGRSLTQQEIDDKLKQIAATIPEKRLADPHEIAAAALFLLSDASSYMQGSAITVDGGYHSDKEWLEKEGRLKELYQCVEFTTTAIFEREIKRMPVIVLHELAHAYHYQVLGFDNALIKAAFERARNSGSYEVVLRNDGNKEKAYALTNPQEYFAESTEAYFGRNDFFPFVRDELQQHDPAMVKVLQEVWQVEPDASNAVILQ